jgi:hypothetical protein
MARVFSSATAEQALLAVEAVVAFAKPIEAKTASDFADLTESQATKALNLSVDLGLLTQAGNAYAVKSPLCRMLRTPHEKERAAILRIALEAYEPFCVFREELEASGDAGTAAHRTKHILELDAHREEIKDTLLSLATFSGALHVTHGGKYSRDSTAISQLIGDLKLGCEDFAASIQYVRSALGTAQASRVSHEDVILPIAAALRHALAQSPREAVLHSGNAMDTFLEHYAHEQKISLQGKHGINAKIDEL